MLVWGGIAGSAFEDTDYFADGAGYDPQRRAWRKLPAAPITGRWKHSLVWTGREAIIWGGWDHGDKGDGATYRPEPA
jgi:N-acetylneuraminic acid mutarotase